MQNPTDINVLVIDDDEIAREFLCDVLRRFGFVVDDLPGAIGVTNKIVRDKYHVVVLDVMMPAIRGDKLAGLLRKNPHLQGLGVVMVSSASPAELRELAEDFDPADVINKADARTKLPPAVLRAAQAQEGAGAKP